VTCESDIDKEMDVSGVKMCMWMYGVVPHKEEVHIDCRKKLRLFGSFEKVGSLLFICNETKKHELLLVFLFFPPVKFCWLVNWF